MSKPLTAIQKRTIHQAVRSLQTKLARIRAERERTMERRRWTDEEIELLLAVDLRDETTWPEMLRDKLRPHPELRPFADTGGAANLGEMRQDLLTEAVMRRTEPSEVYGRLLWQALQSRIPVGAVELGLLQHLESTQNGREIEIVEATYELAPKLDAILPPISANEIMRRLGTPRPKPEENA
jgi:hypothetical protein